MLDHPERRKNGARRHDIDIAYQVLWNEQRRAFDIQRAGIVTGGSSKDKSTAIGMAIRSAQDDAKDGRKVVVYPRLDGQPNVEWSS